MTLLNLTAQATSFAGILLQALAIVWIWRDWKMSLFQHSDWKRQHRESESQTLKELNALWSKFSGSASEPAIDWDSIGSIELEGISKEFPTNGDDEDLRKRKVQALTPRYGIGPSSSDLIKMQGRLEYLAILRRGVADYRTFIRTKTFRTALTLMLVGFALQLWGSWPTQWTVEKLPIEATLPDQGSDTQRTVS